MRTINDGTFILTGTDLIIEISSIDNGVSAHPTSGVTSYTSTNVFDEHLASGMKKVGMEIYTLLKNIMMIRIVFMMKIIITITTTIKAMRLVLFSPFSILNMMEIMILHYAPF